MRQYTKRTIKRNFFAAMLLAPFVPVVLALSTGGYLYWNHAQQGVLDRLTLLSTHYVYMLDRYMEDCLGDLTLVGAGLSLNSDSSDLREILGSLTSKRKEIVDVALVDSEGAVQAYAGPNVYKGTHVVPGLWLDEALERGSSISGVMSGQLGLPHYVMSKRFSQEDKTFVLRISLDPEVFTQMLTNVREDGVDVFLINRKGEVVAGSGGQVLTREQELVDPVFLSRIGTAFWDPLSNAAYSSRVMRHAGWILAARKYSPSLYRATDSAFLFLGLSVLCGGIIVFLSSLYLTGYIEKMLQQRDDEREKLREQLYRAGRLAELGEMSAGFAHEINNPLQIMKSDQAYIEMLLHDFRERAGEDEQFLGDINEMGASLNQIKLQIDRCARITHSILSFGRAGNTEAQNIDLAKFIPEVLTMIKNKVQLSNIILRVNISPARLIVHVDPARLQQVLLNLLNNAMFAVSEVAGTRAGEIELSCVPEGVDKIRIAIKDNGCGIDANQQQLIFTPFYTTKPAGSGTGLGLSVCHGIVDSMKGVLDFTSEKGHGATFFLIIPRVSASAQ